MQHRNPLQSKDVPLAQQRHSLDFYLLIRGKLAVVKRIRKPIRWSLHWDFPFGFVQNNRQSDRLLTGFS